MHGRTRETEAEEQGSTSLIPIMDYLSLSCSLSHIGRPGPLGTFIADLSLRGAVFISLDPLHTQ